MTELHVLAVGDVYGSVGLDFIKKRLWKYRNELHAELCVVNGENTALIGITPEQAWDLFDAGADVVTLGNHSYKKKEIGDYLEDNEYLLRPANDSPLCPGRGMTFYPTDYGEVCVINLLGRCDMQFGPDNPFLSVDKLLIEAKKRTNCIVCDFHAEATSEKLAMGYYLDGRVSAVWGTHTHVQTADERVLPKGTGYITDLGMTGAYESVIGTVPEKSIAYFKGEPFVRFEPSREAATLCGALFTIDADTGRCVDVQRLKLR